MGYDDLTKALALLSKVIATKGLQEDLKVANFYIQDGQIKVTATDGRIFCISELEGSYDLEGEVEEKSIFAIYIKEATDILDKFRGLQRTKVDSVELYIKEHGVVMTVNEVAKGEENPEIAILYKQSTRFMLRIERVKKLLTDELPNISVGDGAVEINSKDLQVYLDYLYTPICRPKNPALVQFVNDKVYVILGNVWGVVMENNLPEIFRELSLNHYAVGFLKEIITESEKFKVTREEMWGSDTQTGESKRTGIILTVSIGKHIVKLKTADETSKTETKPFTDMPEMNVDIDKFYFLDVLKRISAYERAFIEVDIQDGVGTMAIKTVKTRQQLPLSNAQGTGQFSFAVNLEHLNSIIFSHITKTIDGEPLDSLKFGFRQSIDPKSVELTCTDNTGLWTTKYPRAPKQEPPKLDF